MSRFAQLFELDREAFRWARAAVVLVVVLVPVLVLIAVDEEIYATSVVFAVLFVGLSDPGGTYRARLIEMTVVGLIGALLTLWGIGLGDGAWGLVVASVFVVTLAAGLSMKFGLQRFIAALMLNVWFLVALSLSLTDALAGIKIDAWSQTLAWLAGSALWIMVTFVAWLIRGRTSRPQPISEFPADTSMTQLTRPAIVFAVIRAVAVSAAAAIAFGVPAPNADWMPVATLVAMKGTLQQSTLVAEQRLVGTIIGAVVAAAVVLTVTKTQALELIIVLLAGSAAAIRYVNYAWYCAAISGLLLIGMDAAHPTDFTNEGRRIFFTLIGVGIAVAVMYVANLIQRWAATPTQAEKGR